MADRGLGAVRRSRDGPLVPGRASQTPYDLDADVERRILSDLQRNPPPAAPAASHEGERGPAPPARKPMPPPSSGGAGSDDNLTSAMVRRLAALERELNSAKSDVRNKEAHIMHLSADSKEQQLQLAALRSKLASEREAAAAVASSSAPDAAANEAKLRSEAARLRQNRDAIRDENGRLRRQIIQMQAFLRDYGMIWVGEDGVAPGHAARSGPAAPDAGPGPSSEAAAAHGAAAAVGGVAPFAFDMAQVAKSVAELNLLAGEGQAEVSRGAGGARVLRTPLRLPLTLYRDGLVVDKGPFRPWEEPAARAFVQDILDGYFPSELKRTYPEGVPFKLKDASEQSFKRPFQAFTGAGRALAAGAGHKGGAGGMAAPLAALASGAAAVHSLQSLAEYAEAGSRGAPPAPLSKDAFLSKLPAAVIRNGRIVDVRGSIGAMLAPGGEQSHTAAAAGPSGGLPPSRGPRRLLANASEPSLLAAAGGPLMDAADLLLGPAARQLKAAGQLPLRPMSAGGGVQLQPVPRPPSSGGVDFSQPVLGSRPASRPTSATLERAAPPVYEAGAVLAVVNVKREDGGHTYTIRLRATDLVADLRRALDRLRAPEPGGFGKCPYEMRTAFPAATLNDLQQSLQAAGLAPNGTVFLRAAAAGAH